MASQDLRHLFWRGRCRYRPQLSAGVVAKLHVQVGCAAVVKGGVEDVDNRARDTRQLGPRVHGDHPRKFAGRPSSSNPNAAILARPFAGQPFARCGVPSARRHFPHHGLEGFRPELNVDAGLGRHFKGDRRRSGGRPSTIRLSRCTRRPTRRERRRRARGEVPRVTSDAAWHRRWSGSCRYRDRAVRAATLTEGIEPLRIRPSFLAMH